ncbi:hypothetical protein EHI8A_074600 [Entamoeba histolytica HM-1:IMSS-B]|uniref:MD-2-related lipid-recognition domain-containing protein n=6 Tax=Entamoeba histolytica TaxID=5759 RepID=C4LU19_ENTH1|nr:hypothetical protein EHI_068260 [Entamoeba histolytica HM-1:IMSS]EMD47689.1 Hypothetical protein EHI5A_112950 [Entamoeba histolytica KU27]EMH72440.1 hypothetical protein EHI8A_074600 [Entamoeba histolytica HM-1:IMSS-B]EMS16973.1 hypothetical protein KM1_132660 [Entamoeba histolytica HM-3:IMSS]ENY61386.1 hypothetical protein EHI7A_072340 [Entamoeba histolytica HM-1:IMSS-A]GAT92086.1 hypothetical protein CL6EHI_068260 [Entamoeba histolytica]|eukprot:XP_651720.1 hypothetical protein EHI_068260 [Entamoeba histolytica HM-1:IMSS]
MFVLFILFTTLFAANIDYSICLPEPTQTEVIFTKVDGDPWPPVIGSKFKLNMVGVLDRYCETFIARPLLKMHNGDEWTPVPLGNKDLCGTVVRCPVLPGPISIKFEMEIPNMSPPGTYKGEFTFTDGDYNITCLGFMLDMK